MHAGLIFLVSSFASFFGSLQLGPVNLYVIDTALHKNKKSAFWVAFGGIIPEFIYCSLAVYSKTYFTSSPAIFIVFKILLISILLVFGMNYLFKKNKPLQPKPHIETTEISKSKHFFKGLMLAMLNPQLLTFWIIVMVFFDSISYLEIKSEFDKIAYIIGAGFGALILLVCIISTINKFRKKILTWLNNKYYNKVLALLLIAIALQQLITLL